MLAILLQLQGVWGWWNDIAHNGVNEEYKLLHSGECTLFFWFWFGLLCFMHVYTESQKFKLVFNILWNMFFTIWKNMFQWGLRQHTTNCRWLISFCDLLWFIVLLCACSSHFRNQHLMSSPTVSFINVSCNS